jgi:hypothetical protein
MSGTPISRRINHIYHTYYRERAKEKFIHTMEWVGKYGKLNGVLGSNFDFFIDDVKLGRCLESYYLDVIKYKEYHFNPDAACSGDVFSKEFSEKVHSGEKFINSAKVAAFTTKWLLKARPIYVRPVNGYKPTITESTFLDAINETFVLGHVLDLMGLTTSQFTGGEISDLLYHLKYRSSDDRCLMLIYSLMEKVARQPPTRVN